MEKNRIVIFKEFLNELREIYLKNGEDGLMKDYDWAVYFSDDMIESESPCCVADDVTVTVTVVPTATLPNPLTVTVFPLTEAIPLVELAFKVPPWCSFTVKLILGVP